MAAVAADNRDQEITRLRAREAAAIENLRGAWRALRMIRETVEMLGPRGLMRSEEEVLAEHGAEFEHEALAIIEGVRQAIAAAKGSGNG